MSIKVPANFKVQINRTFLVVFGAAILLAAAAMPGSAVLAQSQSGTAEGSRVVIDVEVEAENTGANSSVAEILFSKGDVTSQPVGDQTEKRKVAAGDRFFSDTFLQTGENGFVSLILSGQTIVNIQPGSRLQLSWLACNDGNLPCIVSIEGEQGQFVAEKISNLQRPTTIAIDTPYLAPAVRGPVFVIDDSLLDLLSD